MTAQPPESWGAEGVGEAAHAAWEAYLTDVRLDHAGLNEQFAFWKGYEAGAEWERDRWRAAWKEFLSLEADYIHATAAGKLAMKRDGARDRALAALAALGRRAGANDGKEKS